MQIIAGRSNIPLAKKIASALKVQCIIANVTSFPDKELKISIPKQLYAETVVIVQSTSTPANDYIMELLLLADAVKRAGAKKIIAVMPYFGYSRQDKSNDTSYNFEPISAATIASILEAAGINEIITIDLHKTHIEKFFKIKIQNLASTSLFAKVYEHNFNYNFSNTKQKHKCTIVSPDQGGIVRANSLGEKLKLESVIINKKRNVIESYDMSTVIGNVISEYCILVDDIVDSCNTLCKAAELLMQRGATTIDAYITHGVLSNNAVNNINNSAIKRIFLTDTIHINTHLSSKFNIISVCNLITESLTRTN